VAQDKWTLLVLRGLDQPAKQYSLSPLLRKLTVAVGVTSAAVVVLSATVIGFGLLNQSQLADTEARNSTLEAGLAQLQAQIANLEATLDRVAEDDAHFRSLAGLETISPEVMAVGVGGPGLGTPESLPFSETDSETAMRIYSAVQGLSELERRAKLLSESLAEATDSVRNHRELLESTPSILPTEGWISSGFSESRVHPLHHLPMPHLGIDISAPAGTPIVAAAKGRVTRSSWVVGYGLTIEIDHGFGFTTLYSHASELVVQAGESVTRGQVIAKVGSTGTATAPNLHYEVKVDGIAQDPYRFILPNISRN
jgi:murein DD-endopeptidase MepM/ murein hydrolase activator NlpD